MKSQPHSVTAFVIQPYSVWHCAKPNGYATLVVRVDISGLKQKSVES